MLAVSRIYSDYKLLLLLSVLPRKVDVHACSASVSVCERAGRWEEVLRLWPTLQKAGIVDFVMASWKSRV